MRRRAALAAALAATFTLSGCGLGNGLYDIPLPGGADLGDHPYSVRIQFSDALDLVTQSAVKVDDVPVGRVTSISLEKANGRVADVVVEVNGDVHLPANAVASIDQTSLLGEKYVSLGPPLGTPATGRLRNHATIPLARSSQGVEVEAILGALSELLTGGGIGTLNEITRSLNTALDGHEPAARALLTSFSGIVSDLSAHRASITRALDALATLSGTLRRRDSQISNVITNLEPGIAELAAQRRQLITMLSALNRLSTVTVATLAQSKEQIVGDLRALAPVLANLAAAGTALPDSLQVLLTYPFPDAALQAIVGDYVNAYVTTAFSTPGGTVVAPGLTATRPATASRPATHGPAPTHTSAPPALLPATSAAAPGLPSTLTTSPGTGGR